MSHFVEYFEAAVFQQLSEKELNWMKNKALLPDYFQVSFVAAPRFIAKNGTCSLPTTESQAPITWPLIKAARVLMVLSYEKAVPAEIFEKNINTLFETAEINEAVALYAALPYVSKPQVWLSRATDAVRSNIADVFDAIAFNNDYPKRFFSELAFNQLVLKCIFNQKSIAGIVGLAERLNKNLADTFVDFAHERWAAGREVPANAWQIMVPFVNEALLPDLQKLFESTLFENRVAAHVLCRQSDCPGCKALLESFKKQADEQQQALLGWAALE